MRLEIPERVNTNCHVFKLGYTWPVCVWGRWEFQDAKRSLMDTFGQPNSEMYYGATYSNQPPAVKSFWLNEAPGDRRWYAGQRLWRRRENPTTDFWFVFRNERDRTMAMMLLN